MKPNLGLGPALGLDQGPGSVGHVFHHFFYALHALCEVVYSTIYASGLTTFSGSSFLILLIFSLVVSWRTESLGRVVRGRTRIFAGSRAHTLGPVELVSGDIGETAKTGLKRAVIRPCDDFEKQENHFNATPNCQTSKVDVKEGRGGGRGWRSGKSGRWWSGFTLFCSWTLDYFILGSELWRSFNILKLLRYLWPPDPCILSRLA